MTAPPSKFGPVPTRETAPYWEGCRNGELRIQRCAGCGHMQFYPRSLCTVCASLRLEWVAASGRGRVASYTIVRRPLSEAWAAEVPYVVALIELEEGPTMMSNVIGCEVGQLRTGLAVEVLFEPWSADIAVPKFRPVAAVS